MDAQDFKEFAPDIPHRPGVYHFLDDLHEPLYIGKAKDLRKRLASYFNKHAQSGKTAIMLRKSRHIHFTLVDTEADALLLENTLIKKHRPRYNVLFRDDKSYPYICIKNEHFPRVFPTRHRIKDGSLYFGPYTSMQMVRTLLEMIRAIYPLRTCSYNLSTENIQAKKFKVCLEYHIKNCKGPCEGLQSKADYEQAIEQIKAILKGHTQVVIRKMKTRIKTLAANYSFEQAHALKEKLILLKKFQSRSVVVNPRLGRVDVFGFVDTAQTAFVSYLCVTNGAIVRTQTLELRKKVEEEPGELLLTAITELRRRFESTAPEVLVPFEVPIDIPETIFTIPHRGDKRKLLDLALKNAHFFRQNRLEKAQKKDKGLRITRKLKQVKRDLGVSAIPWHIECFDNSNIQGTNPVAGMVVFRKGRPDKQAYRHYHIKTVKGADDFASMAEVVSRRYKRLQAENKPIPDLILIDGGKGQLNAAMRSLKALQLKKTPEIRAIAKRLELIYKPGDALPLHIDKRAETLRFIQQIRNEAHRFALQFHRDSRSRGSIKTILTDIEGIGEQTANKLLRHFKSVARIQKTPAKQLSEHIGAAKTKQIQAFFQQQKKD